MTLKRTETGTGGLTLRRAALVAGLAYLTNPVMFAELYAMPRLVSSNPGQTLANLSAHPHLFAAAILCYTFSLAGDVVLAWSLYVLLAPVHRALSLLAAWFQLTYAAASLAAVGSLGVLYRLVLVPAYAGQVGSGSLPGLANLLLAGFRAGWGLGLILFGMHLVVLGWLIRRSTYIPRWLGWWILLAGFAYIFDSLSVYLFPNLGLSFLAVFFVGELVFMVWLLAWGRSLQEPAPEERRA